MYNVIKNNLTRKPMNKLRISNALLMAVGVLFTWWLSCVLCFSADETNKVPYNIICEKIVVVGKETKIVVENDSENEVIVSIALQVIIDKDWRHAQTSIFDEVHFYSDSGLAKRIPGRSKLIFKWHPFKQLLPLKYNIEGIGRLKVHIIYGKTEGSDLTIYSTTFNILTESK